MRHNLQCITIEYMNLVTVFLQETVPQNDPLSGAVIAMQTFSDFLEFNSHARIHVMDGCFMATRANSESLRH